MSSAPVFSKKPTLKFLFTWIFIWFLGVIFSILAMTNFLTQSPFQRSFFMTWFSIVFTTVVLMVHARNYFKSK